MESKKKFFCIFKLKKKIINFLKNYLLRFFIFLFNIFKIDIFSPLLMILIIIFIKYIFFFNLMLESDSLNFFHNKNYQIFHFLLFF
jgi:hypothetical protein